MVTHLIIGDQHAHPEANNDRAVWLGRLIVDVRPDIVVNLGDAADLDSLCSFDWGKRNFFAKDYRKDIEAHLDFQHKLWSEVKKVKRKLPRRIFIEGNHEQRISRALETLPAGALSFDNLELSDWYDDVVRYAGSTPGTIDIDGILYSHYFVSGIKGNSISSEHMASALITKNLMSSTCGHTHMFDFSLKTKADGKKLLGCSAGCYIEKAGEWAGETDKMWDKGILIKRNVEGGCYDPQWISMAAIKREYAT